MRTAVASEARGHERAGTRCTLVEVNTPEKHTDDGETLHNPAAQDSASNNLRGEPASDRPAG